VPFVEDEHTVFLKTIIPSRKATKQYLGEESDGGRLTPKGRSCSSPSSWASGSLPAVASANERVTPDMRKATFRKDRRLNIRLSSKDLDAIQKRALAEGLPYQTLIASLLHKYAAGRPKRSEEWLFQGGLA